jgi:hypothetical protein
MTDSNMKRQDQQQDPTIGKPAVEKTAEGYETAEAEKNSHQPLDPQTEKELGEVEAAIEKDNIGYDDWG